ncbi:uncharacterized protein LOC107270821 isoform X2 [Cephus cinctus]|uniref:Uncharacterized protein LOC107270821 isoform X2 n=1 Tax=Cephus cinctus TaxID=211228 RepID=A0AAJ7RNI5_CEPCN|nr:uncharacterized protein LOC107270821 isoform X2 [Cephus cinctus]XP_024944161.1 uncharacterized protein LOC107270821 isoform X2 [Cephus cinctus]
MKIQRRGNFSVIDMGWKTVKERNDSFTEENKDEKQTLKRCVSLVEDTCREYKALLDMIYTKTSTASRTTLPSTTLNNVFTSGSSEAMINSLREKNFYKNMHSRVYSDAKNVSLGPIKSTATMNKSRKSNASSKPDTAIAISEENEKENNVRCLWEFSTPRLYLGKDLSGHVNSKKSVRLIDPYKLHRCNSLASFIQLDAGYSN